MSIKVSFDLVPYKSNSSVNQVETVRFIRTGYDYDEEKVTVQLVDSESFETTEFQLDLDELIEAVEILKATRQKD